MLCAMLLTLTGWTAESGNWITILAIVSVFLCSYLVPLVATNLRRGSAKPIEQAGRSTRLLGLVLGVVVAALLVWSTTGQLQTKFGVLGVLITVPAVGLAIGGLTRLIISQSRLPPLIATLAIMVPILGV